jgi:FMN phosphatase YigB (HAD superfamily)
MREPRFIYFDLGNVLLFFDHHIAARKMAALAGIPEELAWKIVFEGDLELSYEAGQINSREFYEEFCRATKTRPDFDALLHASSEIFEVNPRIVPIVAHLHAAQYPLGILSNTSEAHWHYLSRGRYAVIEYFFAIHALSFEIGAMKPDPRIYMEAARLAGVPPEEIFFMDDRPENVAGALTAGFDAVLFENARQLASELRARGVRWNY